MWPSFATEITPRSSDTTMQSASVRSASPSAAAWRGPRPVHSPKSLDNGTGTPKNLHPPPALAMPLQRATPPQDDQRTGLRPAELPHCPHDIFHFVRLQRMGIPTPKTPDGQPLKETAQLLLKDHDQGDHDDGEEALKHPRREVHAGLLGHDVDEREDDDAACHKRGLRPFEPEQDEIEQTGDDHDIGGIRHPVGLEGCPQIAQPHGGLSDGGQRFMRGRHAAYASASNSTPHNSQAYMDASYCMDTKRVFSPAHCGQRTGGCQVSDVSSPDASLSSGSSSGIMRFGSGFWALGSG